MRKFFFLVLVLQSLLGSSQKDLLVPFRVGDLFGLSDLDGKIKLKAQFDLIQPIGSGYFTYTIKQKAADTIYNRQSFEIREKTISTQGLLLGTKVIIKNSNHNHFTFVPEGLIIGSQESYVSKNSNFYTLKGEKLLTENVSKFRFLGNPSSVSSHSRFITIFAEHFDKSMSLLVFDAEKQLNSQSYFFLISLSFYGGLPFYSSPSGFPSVTRSGRAFHLYLCCYAQRMSATIAKAKSSSLVRNYKLMLISFLLALFRINHNPSMVSKPLINNSSKPIL